MLRILRRIFTRPGQVPGLVACLALALVGVVGAARPAMAQQAPAQTATPVLTLDFEKLFEETAWGKRIRADLARDSNALNDENSRIADDLVAEEKDLTERRPTLDPAEFRKLANAFDDKATSIRAAQKAKAQALSEQFDRDRQAFFNAAAPLLDQILAQHGAVVVLDRRVIIRGLAQADITGDLVRLMDAQLGTGPTTPAPATDGEATPDTPAPDATQPDTPAANE